MPSDGTKVRKSYQLDADIDRFFKEVYPSVSIWWFINTLLRAFMELHDKENPENKLLQPIRTAAKMVDL